MKYTIKKGEHSAKPVSFGLWHDKPSITRELIFHSDCKYAVMDQYDIEDVNKAFGVGFSTFGGLWKALKAFISKKPIQAPHHIDSARVGWVYNPDRNNINLFAYCYVDGQRIIREILHVALETKVTCTIVIEDDGYVFNTTSHNLNHSFKIPRTHNKKWSYLLGFYFGGNEVPDHNMTLTRNKV